MMPVSDDRRAEAPEAPSTGDLNRMRSIRMPMTPEEARSLKAGEVVLVDGEIEVICEFCSADYHFKLHEFEDDHVHDHGDGAADQTQH